MAQSDSGAGTHPATTVHLRRIYGRSYFGSGGCWGGVTCDENCRTVGSRDNGFVYGPDAVEVIDPERPARFSAAGGDAIGMGREWSQDGEWVPGQGWT